MRIDFIKRFLGTILGYVIMGFFAIQLCLFVFPFVIIFTPKEEKKQLLVRKIISQSFKILLNILELLGLLTIKTDGIEKLRNLESSIVVCNHPSLIDVVIIMSYMDGIQCVVKSKLWKNPFLGMVVRSAQYIRNDISAEIFLEKCKRHLERKENILIFPEGTRSKVGQPIKLQRGVANMAIFTDSNIQALCITCYPSVLPKGEKWYRIPFQKPLFTFDVGPMFCVNDYQPDAPRSIRVRSITAAIQNYYNRVLGYA